MGFRAGDSSFLEDVPVTRAFTVGHQNVDGQRVVVVVLLTEEEGEGKEKAEYVLSLGHVSLKGLVGALGKLLGGSSDEVVEREVATEVAERRSADMSLVARAYTVLVEQRLITPEQAHDAGHVLFDAGKDKDSCLKN